MPTSAAHSESCRHCVVTAALHLSSGPCTLRAVTFWKQPPTTNALHIIASSQELSSDARDWGERHALVAAAMDKFRLALRSRPDFDRGCYNLGTVFYTFALALQGDTGEAAVRC